MDGAERFVVEAGLDDSFAELFAEAVDGLEDVCGGGGDAGGAGFEELVVAVVDEAATNCAW